MAAMQPRRRGLLATAAGAPDAMVHCLPQKLQHWRRPQQQHLQMPPLGWRLNLGLCCL
jgi:hypothetical protein